MSQPFKKPETTIIGLQNDQFRKFGLIETDCVEKRSAPKGTLLMTQGVRASLGEDGQPEMLMLLVASFDDFTEDNDPYGDRDFGEVVYLETKYWWKIDLYDNQMEGGSPNPEDPSVTHRVLTLLLPSEY